MKKLLLSIILATALSYAHAIVVQKVFLKNGTELNGYIQQQDGKGNITFRSDNALVCISGINASTPERVYSIGQLPKEWVDWATKNDAFKGAGNERTLTLNDITFTKTASNEPADSAAVDEEDETSKKGSNGNTFSKTFLNTHSSVSMVKVLEKGVVVKYLELTPSTYYFTWDDVDRIVADKRPKTMLSSIDRIYQLADGREVRGQYAGESKNTLSLYTSDGMVETYDIDKVSKYFYKPVNPNQNIFEQSPLLDVVKTKAGEYRGVIVERNFTKGNYYLVLQQQSGSSQSIKFADIITMSKEPNSGYKPQTDIILKNGEVLINRIHADSVNVTRKGSNLVLADSNIKVALEGGTTKITLEYNNPQKKSADNLILVRLTNTSNGKKAVYGFSTDIFEMKKYSSTHSETSVNNTTKVEYTIPGQGSYAFYDQETKKAMPFTVK